MTTQKNIMQFVQLAEAPSAARGGLGEASSSKSKMTDADVEKMLAGLRE